MASRSLVDASIDSFWSAAGLPRPLPPKKPPPKRRSTSLSAAGAAGLAVRRAGAAIAAAEPSPRGGCAPEAHAADRAADRAADARPEFAHVSLRVGGREGYNALAVNGAWRFWKVRGGRLAFFKDTEVEADCSDAEEDAPDAEDGERSQRSPSTGRPAGGGAFVTVRLYLQYVPQVDAWLVSDSPNGLGNVVADCGPVGRGADLDQHWRIWDGEGWREDRNVFAEVSAGASPPPGLHGLRVAVLPGVASATLPPALPPALPGGGAEASGRGGSAAAAYPPRPAARARSQDPRQTPPEQRKPLSARLPLPPALPDTPRR